MTRNQLCTPLLETLEDRLLMSTSPVMPMAGAAVTAQVVAVAEGDQLQVVGTDKADTIVVDQTAAGIVLTGNGIQQTFNGTYASLAIVGFGGDDTLRVTNNVTLNTTISGGAGNDQIFAAGKGNDTIYGEADNDLIVSIGGGKDTIYGGDGTDSFWGDSTDVIADVSLAETAAGAVHTVTSFYQPYPTDATKQVSLEIAGQKFTDPGTSYTYADFSSKPLFVNGPQYNDIRQGNVGDCYFLSTLASLAKNRPDTIQQAIAPLGDGTYAVRFYKSGAPVYLRIDGDLPVNSSGSLVYARLTPQGETWVALMEKAYAYYRYAKNTYASLAGGWSSTCFTQLTNASTSTVSTLGSLTNLKNTLTAAVAANQPIAMGTYSNASGPVYASHVYGVKTVTTDSTGNTLVTVYDPFGKEVTLSLADVQKYFNMICVSKV